jgi:hypothetical protein
MIEWQNNRIINWINKWIIEWINEKLNDRINKFKEVIEQLDEK